MLILRILIIISSATILSLAYLSNSQISDYLYAACSIAPALIAYFYPVVALTLFLFLLPVFGNKPASLQDSYLILIELSLVIGLYIKTLTIKETLPSGSPSAKKICSIMSPYTLVSILSLFPVSFAYFSGWFASSQGSLTDLSLLKQNIIAIIFCAEDHPAYPVKTVFLTILSAMLAVELFRVSASSHKNRLAFSWAIFAGFFCSLIVGILDFYEILSIRQFRLLDPVVNPEKFAYRLQSWFGHSGWYAEYLTISAAFVMVLLCLKKSYVFRVSLIIFCLLLAEFVLILTFQRGGWLSYPITLIAIWAAIYVIYKNERGELDILKIIRASFIKIIICAPLTVLISLLVLKVIGSSFSLDQYTSRFKDITKSSDRTDFMRAAIKLGSLNPLFGQGSESFALQYKREFTEPDGKFVNQINLPLHGSAHSLYAQTFMGKGLFGLITLLLLIATVIKACLKFSITKDKVYASDRVIALACSCSLIALAIYGFVQEVFYVNALQVLIFMLIALAISVSKDVLNFKSYKAYLIIILLGFSVHYLLAANTNKKRNTYGCYPSESDNQNSWRWCGLRSEVLIKTSDLRQQNIQISPAMPDTDNNKQELSIYNCSKEVFKQALSPSENIRLNLAALELKQCYDAPDGYIRLKLVTAHYFIPALADPKSLDRRALSFRWIFSRN